MQITVNYIKNDILVMKITFVIVNVCKMSMRKSDEHEAVTTLHCCNVPIVSK